MSTPALFSDQEIKDAGGQSPASAQSSPSLGNTLFSDDEIKSASNPAPAVSPEEQASQTRQMLVSGLTGMPTPNMDAHDRAMFASGKEAGAISVPIVAGAAAVPFANYMGHLDSILKIAKTLGWAGFGIKEAADVYREVKGLMK